MAPRSKHHHHGSAATAIPKVAESSRNRMYLGGVRKPKRTKKQDKRGKGGRAVDEMVLKKKANAKMLLTTGLYPGMTNNLRMRFLEHNELFLAKQHHESKRPKTGGSGKKNRSNCVVALTSGGRYELFPVCSLTSHDDNKEFTLSLALHYEHLLKHRAIRRPLKKKLKYKFKHATLRQLFAVLGESPPYIKLRLEWHPKAREWDLVPPSSVRKALLPSHVVEVDVEQDV